jgi:hypothetical protein
MTMKQSSLKTLKMSTQLSMQTRHSTVRRAAAAAVLQLLPQLLLLTAWGPQS